MWTYCANSHDTADELNKLRISTAKNKFSQGVEPGTDYQEQIELVDSKYGAESFAMLPPPARLAGRGRSAYSDAILTGRVPGSGCSKAD